jgi:hypothetical protein
MSRPSREQRQKISAFQTLDGVGIDGKAPCVFKVASKLLLNMHKMGWPAFYNWKNLPHTLTIRPRSSKDWKEMATNTVSVTLDGLFAIGLAKETMIGGSAGMILCLPFT